MLNQTPVSLADLDPRLRTVFAQSADQTIFVRGDKDIYFEEIAQVIDIAKGAGAVRVGLITHSLDLPVR